MSEELKPCPFCGAAASIESNFGREWWAQCSNLTDCGAADARLFTKPGAAIAAWNRRTDPASPAAKAVEMDALEVRAVLTSFLHEFGDKADNNTVRRARALLGEKHG